ncbi:hypothetical protein BLOT_013226 [Blomia tropicalis]|nr:hypothetical protein BLOT_013226 [Blomia tropicalis]
MNHAAKWLLSANSGSVTSAADRPMLQSDQLSKPTTNFVLDIYTRFLNKFGDYGLDQPDLMACERLSRVHMMGDMIYVWNVFNDIMKPKRQGTLEILSFLCKHYLQLSDIKGYCVDISNERQHLPPKMNALKEEKLEIKNLIEVKTMMQSSSQDKFDELDHKLQSEMQLNEKFKQEMEVKSNQQKQIKAEFFKLKEKLDNIKTDISNEATKCNDYKTMIVQSPNKIIGETKRLEKSLNELQAKINSKKLELEQLKDQLEYHQNCTLVCSKLFKGDLKDCMQLVMLTSEEVTNLEDINKEISAICDQINYISIGEEEKKLLIKKMTIKYQSEDQQFKREYENKRELIDGLQDRLKNSEKTSIKDEQKNEQLKQNYQSLLKKLDQVNDIIQKLSTSYDVKIEKLLLKLSIPGNNTKINKISYN